ncbi:MAG TPA: hypothetical protein VFI28_12190 [Candidatus Limnocylindrales bacterium]|nr:hypothetical protein [Candidatus Limnocylindrales bacterium]
MERRHTVRSNERVAEAAAEGVAEAPVLRLFRFRPAHPAFDAILREVMLPDLVSCRGLRAVFAGRQGPDETGERIVASVWETETAMADAVGLTFDQPRFHPEHLRDTVARRLEILPIACAVDVPSAGPPALIRLLVGRAKPGRLDDYVDAVRSGARSDIESGSGPLALYLARSGEDEFVTLSAWAAWSTVAEATGSSTRAPDATRHTHLLEAWTPSHYEAILIDGVRA